MHKHNDKTINPCIPTLAEDHENDLPPENVKLIYKLEFMERCFTVKICKEMKELFILHLQTSLKNKIEGQHES